MITLPELEAAAAIVHRAMPPTPHIAWPLLAERTGTEVWVKHENHTPIGAFKVRGGLVYLAELQRRVPRLPGVIAATRGNHGQAVAFAARQLGVRAILVVPKGNAREKNAAMRALGGEVVEEGEDFQAALEWAHDEATARGLHFVQSFHPLLVRGQATYALEFLRAVPDLDTVYVPVGMGSGICGVIAVRNALGLATKVVGVVAENAPAYALSFAERRRITTPTARTIADGLACRVPDPEALAVIFHGAERFVTVSEGEIRAAMRAYLTDTHNLAEGASAAGLAALLQEPERMRGRKVGLIHTGGNVDREVLVEVLGERGAGSGERGAGPVLSTPR
ncbi:MAG TPA: threonine dehydratase [Gemmatimonadales bacterium]|nr:threonine dehydratase [Gemmatimonadales bacterium]